MSPLLIPVGGSIHLVGLALMVGGMLALGAFTAPVLFKSFDRLEAGTAMTLIFRRYDMVLMVAVGLVLGGEAIRALATQINWAGLPWWQWLRYGIMVAMASLVLYSQTALSPVIEAYQEKRVAGETVDEEAFSKLHKRSEGLYKVEMVLALFLLCLFPLVSYLEGPSGASPGQRDGDDAGLAAS